MFQEIIIDSPRKSDVAMSRNVDTEMYFHENTYGIKTEPLEQEVWFVE